MTEPSAGYIQPDQRAHRIIAGAVLLYAIIQFFSTVAPTTSFWDCGEFIACSYSLGVPHPPGAPFYLLLGRFFTMFFPAEDVGFRVNALSAIVSALTVLLTYLIIVRLVRKFRGPETSLGDRVVMYGSGVIGALSFSASHSFWFNGVEAEVYAISMFFTALVIWLAMRWMDAAEKPVATRYLLLIAYIVGLATGVHLLNVLALSPIVLLVFFHRAKFSRVDLFSTLSLYTGGVLVVLGIVTESTAAASLFMILGVVGILAFFGLHLSHYFKHNHFSGFTFFFAMLISFVAIGVVYPGVVTGIPSTLWNLHTMIKPMLSPDANEGLELMWLLFIMFAVVLVPTIIVIVKKWRTASVIMGSLMLVMIGYTTYATIYIRSNQKPVINENQPDNISAMISYLNREQYGAVGPVETQNWPSSSDARLKQQGAVYIRLSNDSILRFNVLERQAKFWSYQINQMYMRYLSWQFFYNTEYGQAKLYFFPFLLGVIGLVGHFFRDRRRAFFVMMLFLMTGLAIVLYLNQPNPQPRERDYAYVGSYFAFALWIGIGVTVLYEGLEESFRRLGPGGRKTLAIVTVALAFILSPINMIARNWESHSRKGNFVAWDYSRNMLESCEPGGILFTNGDNDTFPLWYLQVVEGLRTDVRVVNLSLLNTNWYIKQLRDEEPKVPVELSDRVIDERLTGRSQEALLARYWPPGRRSWTLPKPDGGTLELNIPATMYVPTGLPDEQPGQNNFLRVQDMMILHILEANRWRRPIYFAVTVSNSNLLGLHDYLAMEGLVFRIHPEKVPEVDEPKLRENMFETYATNYRNLNNPDVFYFGNVTKLMQNYRSGFLQLVYEYYQGTLQETQASSGVPEEQRLERFDELTNREKALFTLRFMEEVIPHDVIPYSNRELVLQMGRIYADLGAKEEGAVFLEHAVEMGAEDFKSTLQTAFYVLEYTQDKERAVRMVTKALDNRGLSTDDLFQAAAILERAGSTDELRDVLERILEDPNLNLRDRSELSTFFVAVGDTNRAMNMLEELREENPEDGSVMGALVEVYRMIGDTTNA
ncbi:DUF2723 domain-containing protein, partial [bacterium]|nr:DUF2723 domain-containing protein [bacterium]